jgi:LPS export ABC transporter protein LptC
MFLFRSKILFFLFCLIVFISCKQKKQTKTEIHTNFPSRTTKNALIHFNENGKQVVEAKGKLIEEYEFIDTPYTYFPKGIELEFYERGKPNPGKLFADQAKVFPTKLWYEARGNVVIISPDGDTIKSATIFWDRRKKVFFSPDRTIIIKNDKSTIYAEGGIEASEDLKNYTLKNDQGFAFPK